MDKKMGIKQIRDSIHNYIEIPNIIVSEIIDTNIFQRLRQIEQTSMRALFPSAHHDRFIHSIGVYHLGVLAYQGVIDSIKNKPIYEEHKFFWEHYKLCFHLACLLHDCAHAPMSHSFEYGYLDPLDEADCAAKMERLLASMTYQADRRTESGLAAIERTEADIKTYFAEPEKIAPHEMISALLAEEYYGRSGHIRRVMETLWGDEEISAEQLSDYIQFMQRAIIGLPYGEINDVEDSFKNCLISLLNGGYFDVDKLDYIIRDSVQSGANNLSIDIPRILNALTLVEIHRFETETEVNDLLLNNSVYFTGCTSTVNDLSDTRDCECALTLHDVSLSGDFCGTLSFEEGNNRFAEEPEDKDNPDFLNITNGRRLLRTLKTIVAQIEGSCKIHGRFNGQINMLGRSPKGIIDGVLNARLSGKLKGTIIGHIKTEVPHQITYEIGYTKTALSVIEDTLLARNRLYLWIYAHNKVAYNDYLLRNGVLRSLLTEDEKNLGELDKKQAAQSHLRQLMDIDKMFSLKADSLSYLLNDGDLIHYMKQSVVEGKVNNPFAEDWLSRTHMHAVWKSYAEYNSFFINLSLSQRKDLWTILFYGMNGGKPISTEANSEEYEDSILNGLFPDNKYVWIKPAGIKLKGMEASNVYIVLSDDSVKRLKDVQSREKVTEQYADESFFYLYTSIDLNPDQKLQLISFLKTQVARMKALQGKSPS